MLLNLILAALALVSLALCLWQWAEARRFPLHREAEEDSPLPGVTLLKPLKGWDSETGGCLRSWLEQDYPARVQILFGVASTEDPAWAAAQALCAEYPEADAAVVLCPDRVGVNAKVSKLVQLEPLVRHEVLVVSDADVRVAPRFLRQVVRSLREPEVRLVSPFYRLANPATTAMQWEAISVNADFWSGVLQARRLQPIRFALGAVMALRREDHEAIGGFRALANHLADDYELGRRLTAGGGQVAICPAVVDCCEPPQGWLAVWRHQLRWARTIRVCMPGPYALSLLSNATLWPLLWVLLRPSLASAAGGAVCLALRVISAMDNQRRLTRSRARLSWVWLTPLKDLLQVGLWGLSFSGAAVEWRGEKYRVTRGGELVRLSS